MIMLNIREATLNQVHNQLTDFGYYEIKVLEPLRVSNILLDEAEKVLIKSWSIYDHENNFGSYLVPNFEE